MNRYMIENLFGIKGFSIAWYGVIIATGMLLGVLLASYRAKKKGYSTDLIFDFAIIAIPFAIVCARTYYVIFEWKDYIQDPIRIFATREGGLAIYGGVIGGLLATFFYESMWNIILFFILLVIAQKARKDGTLIAVYFMGYGLGRFLIEGLRTDSLYLVDNIRVSQMLSLVLIFVGMILLTLLKRNKIKNRVYNGKYLN